MVTNLRDAKAKLSQLVKKVEAGEEVVITVGGVPKVRMIATQDESDGENLDEWIEELEQEAPVAKRTGSGSDDEEFWEKMREERI